MNLWLFTFTQPDRHVASAVIAADTRRAACDIMEAIIQRPLVAQEYTHPEAGTILSFFGRTERKQPGLFRYVTVAGKLMDVT